MRAFIRRVQFDLASSDIHNTYCIVIPHYNHSKQFAKFLPKLAPLGLSMVVVDDGSIAEDVVRLRELLSTVDRACLLERKENGGKGSAVLDGARWASAQGFTHILQIDADGQHSVAGVASILQASEDNPADLISGLPVFSDSVPLSRLHGRKISLWCARIETLSGEIQDVMCGFRVYPLTSLLHICDKNRFGQGMEFDIEVMVRLYWSGVSVRFVSIEVGYPETGRSHYRLVQDNVRVSLMHARLLAGMLWRLPQLLARSSIRKVPG